MRSCQNKLLWILLAAIVVLLVVAGIAGGIYLVLRQGRNATAGWQNPVAATIPEEMAPDLALYPLAGASQLETIDAALANGDLETAYALLVFGLDLSDTQRIGRAQRLAGKFGEVGKVDRATLVHQQIYDVAVLSPALSDPVRADALLANAKGLAALEEEELALQSYDQVYLIASESPYLQMAHRRELLSVLEAAYRDLGNDELADSIRTLIVHLDQEPYRPTAPSGTTPELPARSEPVSSAEVGELEEARRQVVFELLNVLAGGVEPAPELVAAAGEALLAEDAAKLSLYSQELAKTTQPGRRINVHWHLIDWLTLKYQVAVRGFGLSLVPEWEALAPDIQSALSTAYEDLRFEYEDWVTALPDAALMGPGNYDVRRQVIQSGRLGQYPNYPELGLGEKLREAANALIASGFTDRLYVDWMPEDGGLRFFLSPAAGYGQSTQSP